MKKITSFLLTTFLLLSCSTSQITSSQWLSESFKNETIDRLLIFVNSEDSALQSEIENRTAAMLLKNGIESLKMHELFPEIEYKETRSQEEINVFVEECKAKNIDKILFASQKSVRVDTLIAKSLHNYMNSLEPLKLNPVSEEDTQYDVKEITTYTIEAAVYDIGMTTEDKPIATTTIKATDPKSIEILKDRFLTAVEKLFASK